MRKKTWDLYAPIYERAMRADQRIYTFMYERIPTVIMTIGWRNQSEIRLISLPNDRFGSE